MRLTHVNITMPKGEEDTARAFLWRAVGADRDSQAEAIRGRGGVWFDAGGLDIHLSVEESRAGPDSYRHFGLETADVDGLKARLEKAGVEIDPGRPAPWKRFYVRDPFGNRIEIHDTGALRS